MSINTIVFFYGVLIFLAGTSAYGFTTSERIGYTLVLQEKVDFPCLTNKEAELIRLVNRYREHNGLPAVAVSRSLVKVARMHARDLQENNPAQGVDSRGMDCNMHSWSGRGIWTPVCYTNDHRYADLMRSKPREITAGAYDGAGYECAYWSSVEGVNPLRVLDRWEESEQHNALILESGKWTGIKFKAIGVGVSANYAVIWFGDKADSLPTLPACLRSSR